MSDDLTDKLPGALAADRMQRQAEARQRIHDRVRINQFSNSYTVDVDMGKYVLAHFKCSDLYDAHQEAERFAEQIRRTLLRAAEGTPQARS
jgi:hypothetical protein